MNAQYVRLGLLLLSGLHGGRSAVAAWRCSKADSECPYLRHGYELVEAALVPWGDCKNAVKNEGANDDALGLYTIVPPELATGPGYTGNPLLTARHLASGAPGFISHAAAMEVHRMVTQPPLVVHFSSPKRWLETFVDTSRFRGTCYRAANWQVIGTTQGRGHRAPTFEQTRPAKQMWGLPLHRKFREVLGSGGGA